jgi:hypothetical protein
LFNKKENEKRRENMKKYIVKSGCEEWWDEDEFDSIAECHEFTEDSENMTMGLYSATYIYITDAKGNTIETIL